MVAAHVARLTLVDVCGDGRKIPQFYGEKTEKKHFSSHRTFTTGAVLTEVITPPTGDRVLATHEGALCVHAGLATLAWAGMGHTLIYV